MQSNNKCWRSSAYRELVCSLHTTSVVRGVGLSLLGHRADALLKSRQCIVVVIGETI